MLKALTSIGKSHAYLGANIWSDVTYSAPLLRVLSKSFSCSGSNTEAKQVQPTESDASTESKSPSTIEPNLRATLVESRKWQASYAEEGKHLLNRLHEVGKLAQVSRVILTAKSAVEAAGGYDYKLGLGALLKPESFESKERWIHKAARPPPEQKDLVDSIGCLPATTKPIAENGEQRGYLLNEQLKTIKKIPCGGNKLPSVGGHAKDLCETIKGVFETVVLSMSKLATLAWSVVTTVQRRIALASKEYMLTALPWGEYRKPPQKGTLNIIFVGKDFVAFAADGLSFNKNDKILSYAEEKVFDIGGTVIMMVMGWAPIPRDIKSFLTSEKMKSIELTSEICVKFSIGYIMDNSNYYQKKFGFIQKDSKEETSIFDFDIHFCSYEKERDEFVLLKLNGSDASVEILKDGAIDGNGMDEAYEYFLENCETWPLVHYNSESSTVPAWLPLLKDTLVAASKAKRKSERNGGQTIIMHVDRNGVQDHGKKDISVIERERRIERKMDQEEEPYCRRRHDRRSGGRRRGRRSGRHSGGKK